MAVCVCGSLSFCFERRERDRIDWSEHTLNELMNGPTWFFVKITEGDGRERENGNENEKVEARKRTNG